MFDHIDEAYFRTRLAKERSLALAATDIGVRRTHEALAEFYEKKLAAIRRKVDEIE